MKHVLADTLFKSISPLAPVLTFDQIEQHERRRYLNAIERLLEQLQVPTQEMIIARSFAQDGNEYEAMIQAARL